MFLQNNFPSEDLNSYYKSNFCVIIRKKHKEKPLS